MFVWLWAAVLGLVSGMKNGSLFDEEFFEESLSNTGDDKKDKKLTHQKKEPPSHQPAIKTEFDDGLALWQICLDTLRLEVSEIEFNQWLRPLKPKIVGQYLMLFAINPVFIRHIDAHYLQVINQVLLQHSGGRFTAKVQVQSFAPKSDKQEHTPKIQARIEESDAIDENYTFETFVKGKTNMLAYNTCYEIAKKARQKRGVGSNLVFIYGSSGLGKTHLMHAVAHRYQKAGLTYCYFTKDQFFRIAIASMRKTDAGGQNTDNRSESLMKRIAKADLLMIDDVHMINEKNGPKVSQVLMTLFEMFTKGDKLLILASNLPPSQMEDFDSRFLSRFSGGISLPIEPPDMETRVQILNKKAGAMHIELPKDCTIFIAQNISTDVRLLEGALNQIRANTLVYNGEIDLMLVRQAIKDRIEARARAINAENIREVVAEYYGVSVKELSGKKRSREIVRPRQMAMALIRELTHDSFPEIGQVFGGRDHTTVMHACENIARLRVIDPVIDKDYQALMVTLEFV